MAQIKSGDPHGLYRVQIGFVNSLGYNFGQANPEGTINDGTTFSSYITRFAKAAEMAIPDRTVIDFTGGDVWTGSFVYGITSLGSSTLTLSTIDTNMISMVSNSKVDQSTNTRLTIYAENIMLPSPPQVFMATTFRIQSKDADTKGANKYITSVMPRLWVSPKGITGAPNFQAPGESQYTIVPTVAGRMPHGIAFTEAAQSFENDETPNYYIISDYPIHFVGHQAAAGANATINLPYRPVGSAATYATPNSTTQPVQVVVDGVVVDATSIDPVTGVVVVPGPFSGGEYIGVQYETLYVLP